MAVNGSILWRFSILIRAESSMEVMQIYIYYLYMYRYIIFVRVF